MNHPHITFHLNKGLDIKIAKEFLKSKKVAGFNFRKEIIKMHPKIEERDIEEYIDEFYKENKKKLISTTDDFQNTWDKEEKNFFMASDKIFDNLEWKNGKYKSYISILPIGPRFLDSMTFQTCFTWKKNLKGQVIHELFHFQFYNLIKNIPEVKILTEDQVWHLSEIFNDIIQSQCEEIVRIQGYETKVSYPEHKKVFSKYREIWQKSKNIRDFIIGSIKKIEGESYWSHPL